MCDPCPGEAPGEGDGCAPISETAAQEVEGLYRFAVARLGGRAEMAEDVVQQALLIALAHACPPEQAERQRAWLRGVVMNVIRRRARSGRRGRRALRHLAGNADGAEAPRPATPEEDDRTRSVRALFLAVTELRASDQELFYAVYRAGRSHASVAAELGTTIKGVEGRLYRMRSRLRRVMERQTEGTA